METGWQGVRSENDSIMKMKINICKMNWLMIKLWSRIQETRGHRTIGNTKVDKTEGEMKRMEN